MGGIFVVFPINKHINLTFINSPFTNLLLKQGRTL